MRTGLVAVGLALAVVGVAVTMSGVLIPASQTTSEARLNVLTVPGLVTNETRIAVILMTNTSSGTLDFSWSANHSIAVALYQGTPCSGVSHYCSLGAALADWPAALSGSWNTTGLLTFPYLLSMENTEPTNATLRGTVAESFSFGTTTLPTWAVISILAGGVLLVVIGAMAVFLGLFLRAGVYSEPESVTPRYAHELARPGDPLDEPFDEEEPDLSANPPGH